MCGIVGYIGKREAYPILIKGLKRLKYRGYDSAGVAIINDNQLLNVYRPQGETFVFASDGIIETPTVILQEFPSQSYIFRNSTYTEVPVYSFSSFRIYSSNVGNDMASPVHMTIRSSLSALACTVSTFPSSFSRPSVFS